MNKNNIPLSFMFILMWGVIVGFFFSGCDSTSNPTGSDIISPHWVELHPVLEGNHYRGVYFINSDTGWAVGMEGIIAFTTDGGNTWILQSSNTVHDLWDVSFFDADKGWVVGEGGTLLHTEDGGKTWNNDLLLITNEEMRGIDVVSAHKIFAAGDKGTIVYTLDGGRIWSVCNTSESNNLYDIAIVDTVGIAVGENGVILTGTGYHVVDTTLTSIDTVWSSWTPQFSGTEKTLHSVVLLNATTAWVVGDSGLILHTTDAGTTWTRQSSGVVVTLHYIQFIDSMTGWITGDNGTILQTTDGGNTWTLINAGTTHDLYALSFLSPTDMWVVGSLVILHSTDGGDNWQFTPTGTTLLPTFTDVTFVNDSIGFIVGYGRAILRTKDGGNTWEYVLRGTQFSPDDWLRSVYFCDDNAGWCVGGTGTQSFDGIVLSTTDGGESWNSITIENAGILEDVYFINADIGWVVGGNHLYKTTDGGNTWAIQPIPTIRNLNAITCTNAVTGWTVGDEGTVLKTEDGNTWNNVTIMEIIVSIDTTFDAGTPDSIVSIDTTFDYKDVTPPVKLSDVTFIDTNIGWAVGIGGTVLKTTNGGQSWIDVPTTVLEDLVAVSFLDEHIGWAVGSEGAIVYTQDGGEHWQEIESPNTSSYNGIAVVNATRVWVVGNSGKILTATGATD